MLKNLVLTGIAFIAGCFVTMYMFTPSKEKEINALETNMQPIELKENNVIHALQVNNEHLRNEVFICKGRSSRRYHYTPHCRGLKPCSTKIYKISLVDAKAMRRSLCGWENQ